MNSKGFQDLQKRVDGMVCAAETRLKVDNAFSYILDTLNLREKELFAMLLIVLAMLPRDIKVCDLIVIYLCDHFKTHSIAFLDFKK